MKKLFGIITILFLAASSAQAITLPQAQAEGDAWVAPRLLELTTDFETCVASKPLRSCHPTWSSTVLPNTTAASPSLAIVTNNDPGPFVTGCGGCFDDTSGTWVIAGVDIPATSPVQFRANSLKSKLGVGIQLVVRIQFEGVIHEKGYGLFGIATDFDWRVFPE